ncbi:hypothetical protein ACES2L_06495 [Bdellovibrio bacteriovorus]
MPEEKDKNQKDVPKPVKHFLGGSLGLFILGIILAALGYYTFVVNK